MGHSGHILLVDDSHIDAKLIQEALREHNSSVQLTWAQTGMDALRILRRQYPYQDVPRPDVMILDINMPRVSGWDVLQEVKTDTKLWRIPILIWSSSANKRDIDQAYRLSANCYLIKPIEWEEYHNLVRSIEDFWLHTVCLPGSNNPVSFAGAA